MSASPSGAKRRDLNPARIPAAATVDGIGNGVRVLIADDERDTVMTLGILLRSSGFEVDLVQGGADVPSAVRNKRPHAVVLDIGMPDRNGYEIAQELRRTYGNGCPVLIAVTGRAGDPVKAGALGFSHYFTKPCDPLELLGVLSGLQATAEHKAGN